MLETTGDLWNFRAFGWLVVSVNQTVRWDGRAVMGRGIARQACRLVPWLGEYYGDLVKRNHQGIVQLRLYPERGGQLKLVLLPVKKHFGDKADLGMLEASIEELAADPTISGQVFVPLVGCGYGGRWEDEVLPILQRHLADDRFVLVRRSENVLAKYPEAFRPGARRDVSVNAA